MKSLKLFLIVIVMKNPKIADGVVKENNTATIKR